MRPRLLSLPTPDRQQANVPIAVVFVTWLVCARLPPVCWRCGYSGHSRASCPHSIPRPRNENFNSKLALTDPWSQPLSAPLKPRPVGDRPVSTHPAIVPPPPSSEPAPAPPAPMVNVALSYQAEQLDLDPESFPFDPTEPPTSAPAVPCFRLCLTIRIRPRRSHPLTLARNSSRRYSVFCSF